ncbi:hypothetical protein BT93_J0529 [Corymbia citriodora subsp. variegata]|nr:hypothetical protein BT93_J0529 [Corymbia citriodora subsp. variegata]
MENARGKIPDFFKVYRPEYSFQRMLVPRAFLAQLDRPLPGEILLRRRNGWQWGVKVILEAQDAYFEDGWQEFVRDNLVEANDFMVFSHESPGVFRVVLYGHSAVEKKECAPPVEVGEGSEVQEHNSDGDKEKEEKEKEANEDEGRSKRSKKKGNVRDRKTANDNHVDVKRYIDAKNPYFVMIHTPRSSGLNDHYGVLIFANGDFGLELLTESSLHSLVSLQYVPSRVLINYELKLPRAVEFQDPTGRTWRGTVKMWKDGRTWISGWGALCHHNNLKKNDRCICELPEENGVTGRIIKVHIIEGNNST